jgi:hypothetical protein
MIDWKRKLTSRKFWAAVAQFVSMLIIAFHGAQETATQVTAIIMAGAAVVAYIIGEGLTDAAAAKTPVWTSYFGGEEPEDQPPDNVEEND